MAGHSISCRVAAVVCMILCWLNVEVGIQLFTSLWYVYSDEYVADVRSLLI